MLSGKNKRSKVESKEEKIAKKILLGTAFTAIVSLITGVSVAFISKPPAISSLVGVQPSDVLKNKADEDLRLIGTAGEVQYYKDAVSQTIDALQEKNDQLRNAQDVVKSELESEKNPRKKREYQALAEAITEGREINYQTQKQFLQSADDCIAKTLAGNRVEAAECRKEVNQALEPEREGRQKVMERSRNVKENTSPQLPDIDQLKTAPTPRLSDAPTYKKRDELGVDEKMVRGMNDKDRDKEKWDHYPRDLREPKEPKERDGEVRRSPRTDGREREIDRENRGKNSVDN